MPPREKIGTTPERSLSEYIQAYRARAGVSVRELARRAIDPATQQAMHHDYINNLESGTVRKPPEAWRLRALAAGMSADDPATLRPDVYGRHLDQMRRRVAAQWLDWSELLDVEEVDTGGGATMTVSVPSEWSPAKRARMARWMEEMARELDSDS